MATQTLSLQLHNYVINIKHDANTMKYKAYRNKLNKLGWTIEKKHYEEKFVEAMDDMKKIWKIVKNRIHKQNTLTPSFVDNGKVITDKNATVHRFNKFFVNNGPTLASKIQPTNTNYKQYFCGDFLICSTSYS